MTHRHPRFSRRRADPGHAPSELPPLEKDEQRDVYRLYVALGCDVIWFSQPRATMQTPGIPDLKVYCERKALTWWHETKAEQGTQSPAQIEFERRAHVCGEHYILGGWDQAVAAVRVFGLVPPTWEPVR